VGAAVHNGLIDQRLTGPHPVAVGLLRARHMDILYLLLPLSVILVLLILGVLGWSVYRGQFDNLEQEGVRILEDDQEQP